MEEKGKWCVTVRHSKAEEENNSFNVIGMNNLLSLVEKFNISTNMKCYGLFIISISNYITEEKYFRFVQHRHRQKVQCQ